MKPAEIALDARGRRFRGLAWPGPEAPFSLLLHATSFCAEVWAPAWEAAARAFGRPLRAVALDARGHGRSSRPEAPAAYAWTELADDAIACLEALGPPPGGALLVGHSSGATAALAAAARRPDLVRAIAAVEPVLFDVPSDPATHDSFPGSRAMAARARRRRSAFESRDAARVALAERFPYSGFAAPALDAFLAGGLEDAPGGGVRLRCPPEVEAAAYDGAAALDLWPLLPSLRAPVVVVVAEHGAIPALLLERLRAAVPRTELARVPGATHFAPLEAPELVGAALGRFAAARAETATP